MGDLSDLGLHIVERARVPVMSSRLNPVWNVSSWMTRTSTWAKKLDDSAPKSACCSHVDGFNLSSLSGLLLIRSNMVPSPAILLLSASLSD